MRTWIAAIPLLLLAFQAHAQSPGPLQIRQEKDSPPQEVSTRNKQQPKDDERHADKVPIIINIQSPDKPNQEPAGPQKPQKSPPDWLLYLTGIAAGAAVLQGLALFLTIAVTRWGSKRQLRAYISVTPKEVLNWRYPSYRLGIFLMVKNHGSTPGFEITYDFNVRAVSELPKPAVVTEKFIPNNALFPDEELPVRLFMNGSLTGTEIDEIEKGTKSLFMWGTLSYRDVFGRSRWRRKKTTFFAFSCGGKDFADGMKNVPGAKWNWSYAERHNEAT
jgi:hypothetical protein